MKIREGVLKKTALAALVMAIPFSSHAAYKETAVANGGSVKGKVTFKGTLPADAVEKITITKNTDVCGEGTREVVWIDVKDGALKGTFIYIDGIAEGKAWGKPAGGDFLVDQKGCRFMPWAQVVRPGEVVIRNSDKGVLHNINTREMINVESGSPVKKSLFNFGQPDPGDIKKELKPRRSPFISINCEAHNFMFGFILAPEHPYAVVNGADGTFEIGDIPPGKYKVKAWHPTLGVKEGEVTVPAKGAATMNFEFVK